MRPDFALFGTLMEFCRRGTCTVADVEAYAAGRPEAKEIGAQRVAELCQEAHKKTFASIPEPKPAAPPVVKPTAEEPNPATHAAEWLEKFRERMPGHLGYKDVLDKVGPWPDEESRKESVLLWNAYCDEYEEPAPPKPKLTTPRDATNFQPDLSGIVYHHCKAPFQQYVISDQRAVYYLTGDKAGKPVIPRSRDVWKLNKAEKWRPHPELFVQLYDDKGKRREMSVDFLYRNAADGRKAEPKKAAPKVKGKRGRPGKVDAAQVQRLRGQGKTVREIAGILGVGLATIARVPKCSEIKAGCITLNNSNFGTESRT